MVESFELKSLTHEGIPAALQRAEHYRLLNQPELAESICLDILEVDPDNQRVTVVLILAITDQFDKGSGPRATAARQYLERLTSPYERSYYAGIIAERRARAFLNRASSLRFAYQHFREAMDHYEEAAGMRPVANDDAILRWNTCVRTIQRMNLQPLPEAGRELQLE